MALAKHVARKTAAEGSAAAKERKKMDEQVTAIVDALHKKVVALLDAEDAAAAEAPAAAPPAAPAAAAAEGEEKKEQKEDAFEAAYAVRNPTENMEPPLLPVRAPPVPPSTAAAMLL